QSCRDTASKIFWINENLMIAVSRRELKKNDPQSCRDTASKIFWINENLMIAVSRRESEISNLQLSLTQLNDGLII
ncbi:hypothetical protein, partial [Microseira sp. BLCC-F43]|uniref:hypothetical protein n=1 Tax=Microseira sp. BLCC-F43 TaxID=3153602 RepID=UPI0035B7A3EB